MTDKPVIVVAGPTASGKSALARDLAEAYSGTVINADSMQVYKELRVLTARPGADAEARAPHRLFGVLAASDPCSAGRWLAMAADAIAQVHESGGVPIVTGGTGLYMKALTGGLADIPAVPAEINADVRALYEDLGEDAFRATLSEADPDAARAIPAGDGQRLKRALAVVRASGRTLGQWQADQPAGAAIPARFATIAIMPGRDALYAAIDARFDTMMAAGALDEVKALRALKLDPELPAMKALGVPELMRHLAGEASLDDAVAQAKQASRNYAKRQLTWLRNQTAADHVIDGLYGPEHLDGAVAFVASVVES